MPTGPSARVSAVAVAVVTAGLSLATGQAAAAPAGPPATSTTVAQGGMVPGPATGARDTRPDAALPSCKAITYPGNGGKITVQTSPSRTVAWGVNMYNPADSAGKWDIDTFQNGKKTTSGFHRVTGAYIPHGALNPKEARRGARFHVEATLAAADGKVFHSVPNDCIIP